MHKIVVVETEEDEAHFIAAGLDSLAEIEVSGRNNALSLMTTIAMTENAYVIFVIGTASEADRFFQSWLADAKSLAGRTNGVSQASILPATPSIEAAFKDDAWVGRLKQRLEGNPHA